LPLRGEKKREKPHEKRPLVFEGGEEKKRGGGDETRKRKKRVPCQAVENKTAKKKKEVDHMSKADLKRFDVIYWGG